MTDNVKTPLPLRRRFERRINHRFGIESPIAGVIFDLHYPKAR